MSESTANQNTNGLQAVFQLGHVFQPVVLSAARVTARRDERKSSGAPGAHGFCELGGKSKDPKICPVEMQLQGVLLKTLLPNQIASCDLKQYGKGFGRAP